MTVKNATPKARLDERIAKAVADEKKRKEDLAADLARKDVVELEMFARAHGVDLAGAKERDDIVAAIELKLETDAAQVASDKALADMIEDEASLVGQEENRDDATKILRRLNADWCRDVPQGALAGGFEPSEGGPFSGDYPVKDGRYRITGSEWFFDIKQGRLVGAAIATEQNKFGGKSVIAVS